MSHFLEAVGSNGLPHHTQICKRLHATLDPAIIADMSSSVNFMFITLSYQLRTSLFLLTFREELPTRQGIASTPVLSVLLGAGSSALVLCVAPAIGLANPAIF